MSVDSCSHPQQNLVVIGHSHTEPVVAAAKQAGLAIDVLNFWHLPDPFVTGTARLTLTQAIRHRLVAPVFSMVGGAVHQDIGLVLHPRPFDFIWPERPDLPLAPGAEIIAYDALHAVMLERTQFFRDIMSAVRAAVAGPVFHMESPPVFAPEVLPHDDPGFYHFFGADAAFSPPWLRYKLWRVHSGIVAAHCRAIGINFIPYPVEAVDADGFLQVAYHGTPAHANEAYGKLVLAQMLAAASACGTQEQAGAATDEALPAESVGAAQAAVEGWVDGCQDGFVRGWAWQPGAPAEKLILDVFAGGLPAGEGAAILMRADLAELGKGDGACGFAIPVRAASGAALEVRVRGAAALPGGPVPFSPPASGAATAEADCVTVWPELSWTLTNGVSGYIDRFGPAGIHGWAQAVATPSAPVILDLWEDGARIASLRAHDWRKDLEEARQGDGRWGLATALPPALQDGRLHRLALRHPDGSAALDHMLIVRMPARPGVLVLPGQADPTAEEDIKPRMTRPPRDDAHQGVLFSIIVNFYNMRREAARTLTSLSRTYQRGIGTLRYEVLCIDNHSDPPLDAGWVGSFGPEFRLIKPSRRLPSPVAAINAVAAQAQGIYVAIMIDGAHLLTPGVLREVWDAVTEAPDAIVALRQWFVGGDQRWLAEAGYTRAHEDILFDKIGWPDDGYMLFREGAPYWESPRPWFDAMIESNCLFVPASLYREIGGMAEDFSEAGAGYANLDLFRRAVEASPEPPIAIIGEATFHQFHDGTTTNVTLAMKEQRVRQYESHYVALRGQAYPVTNAVDIRLRGQLRNLHAVASWQRPGMPGRIGVTERVRPGSLVLQFDETAQTYLNAVYVENRLHEATRWRGHGLGMAPTDAMAIQDLVTRLRPGRIVVTNPRAGFLLFLDDLLRLLDLPLSRIIAVGDGPEGVMPDRVVRIEGTPRHAATIAAVQAVLLAEETILVIFAPDAGDFLPLDALRAYADFVTPRSYLVFLGTALGQPWLGYSRHWYLTAIRHLLDGAPFAIDYACNPHLVSTSPLGYLQRIALPTEVRVARGTSSDNGELPDAEFGHG